MRDEALVGTAPELYAATATSEGAAPPRGRHLSPRAMRLYVAAADAALLVGVALLLRGAFPATAAAFDLPATIGLALLAALLAVLTRGALRNGALVSTDPAQGAAPRAALAAAIAIGTTGAVCAVVLADRAAMPDDLPGWFGSWFLAGSLGAGALRRGADRLSQSLTGGQRVVVVGPPDQADPLARAVAGGVRQGWRLSGALDDREPGALDRLSALLEAQRPDLVALTVSGPDTAARIAAVCERIADQPVRICLALDAGTLSHLPRAQARIGRFALLDLFDDPHGGAGGMAKRGMDLVLGCAALLALSPVLAVAALAIRLESPGPVLFKQWRFGLGSRPIMVLKFRTMRSDGCDASGERRTVARDPRVTRVGRILRRSSIDELPQLINVIRGEMSLVGPRPHPLHMRVGDAYYGDAVERYRARHLVKPGITGWAQVNGSRGEVDTLEKAKRRVTLDLWYLDNWSLLLDLRILLRTALGGFASPRAD